MANSIKRAIEVKGNKYGALDAPFVVAVNYVGGALSTEEVMEALIGPQTFTYVRGSNGPFSEPEPGRRHDGAWLGSRGPRYTRVSAVLIFDGLNSWGCASVPVRLWKNPWAARPLPASLDEVPRAEPGDRQFDLVDGKTMADLLSLPDDWPGED